MTPAQKITLMRVKFASTRITVVIALIGSLIFSGGEDHFISGFCLILASAFCFQAAYYSGRVLRLEKLSEQSVED